MRIAVIGAGIVGVTSAQALHEDGHEVTVYERRSSVATEASFANAGWLAPGYVTPWAAPGMVRKVLGQWHAAGIGKLDRPPGCLGLDLTQVRHPPGEDLQLLAHVDLVAEEVDRVQLKAEDLPDSQATPGRQERNRPVPLGEGVGDRVQLRWCRDDTGAAVQLRQADVDARCRPDQPVGGRVSEHPGQVGVHHPERTAPGPSTGP